MRRNAAPSDHQPTPEAHTQRRIVRRPPDQSYDLRSGMSHARLVCRIRRWHLHSAAIRAFQQRRGARWNVLLRTWDTALIQSFPI